MSADLAAVGIGGIRRHPTGGADMLNFASLLASSVLWTVEVTSETIDIQYGRFSSTEKFTVPISTAASPSSMDGPYETQALKTAARNATQLDGSLYATHGMSLASCCRLSTKDIVVRSAYEKTHNHSTRT